MATKSGSTLDQVMAFSLTATSHNLNRCKPLINEAHLHLIEDNVRRNWCGYNLLRIFWKITYLKILQYLLGTHGLKDITQGMVTQERMSRVADAYDCGTMKTYTALFYALTHNSKTWHWKATRKSNSTMQPSLGDQHKNTRNNSDNTRKLGKLQ